MKTIIKGNKLLAKTLGLHANTIGRWRKQGLLDAATVATVGRTILYDLDLVLTTLPNYSIANPVKSQRR